MSHSKPMRHGLILVAAVLMACKSPVMAKELHYGEASASDIFNIGGGTLSGQDTFSDNFLFSVAPGESLAFYVRATTGFDRDDYLTNVTATLSRNGAVVAEGSIGQDYATNFYFDDVVIGQGDYTLQIGATAHLYGQRYPGQEPSASFYGRMGFSDAAYPQNPLISLDEPASALFLLGGFSLLALRKRRC